jgi:hypothetical protein
MSPAIPIRGEDIDAALGRVERREAGLEDANLLRNVIKGLQGRVHEMEGDRAVSPAPVREAQPPEGKAT